jgi:SAM-dependent methyltransferase
VIFPQISSDGAIERILFVGVEYYTWHYSKQFRHKQFHTLDIEEDHAAFGNQGLHTIGSVADLTTLFGTDVFDLVLINGLVPAHLSEKTQIDQALVESFRVLKSGGRLIIGWNNYGTLGFLLEDLDGYGLFSTYVPDGVTTPSNRVEANAENKHTFDFLLKPPS